MHDWAYIASTYDGATLRLFINGSQVSSRATTGTLLHTPDPLWIGGNQPYGEYFQGLIDEVRVYDRALSAAAVRDEMLRPVARASRAGLVAAYAFEESSGAVAADASGNGNVGAVIGANRTSDGRFGRALLFHGTGDVVRIPASASLDLKNAMTLAGWIRPSEAQDGWRTILHRETDAYFLAAGSDHDVRLGPLDDVRAALLVGAAVWFSVLLAHGGDRWVGRRRRSWGIPVALFLAGSVADAALAPSLTLIGPALLATWLARTASQRGEAASMYSLAVMFIGVTVASVVWQGSLDLAIEDGDVRSAALGLVLLAAAVPALATAHRLGGGRGRPG